LQGSGARGRITRSDVELSMQKPAPSVPQPGDAPARKATSEHALVEKPVEVPHTRMRRTIAERLSAAKQSIPHFYLSAECVVDALLGARGAMNETEKELRISVNDFVIRAAALALEEVPEANASWSEDAILLHQSIDIAVAVATDGGLITPIVQQANRKGLAAISREMRDLAGRARAGKLSPADYQGGSFSVSNLGMYGIDSVYPIVNPPQSCILGVGSAQQQPVARSGEVAIANVLTLTLSADHRVVDGAVGARLLSAIKRRLQDPLDMLLG
jgi:pyruvate dehydrogenase E2 component (dihydrolipoamide acetyltransferase)